MKKGRMKSEIKRRNKYIWNQMKKERNLKSNEERKNMNEFEMKEI